jgi:hypothetical protein
MSRNFIIQFRVSESELSHIKMKMHEFDYSNCSEYIRTTLLHPIRRNFHKSKSMLYEVNKIGVNLNQSIHHMHKNNITNEELMKVIESTNKLLVELINVYKKL